MSSATIRTLLLAALLSQPDHAFDYSLPAGRWVLLTLKASATATTLYIDGAAGADAAGFRGAAAEMIWRR